MRVKAVAKKTVTIELGDGDYVGARIVCAADLSLGAYLDFTRQVPGTGVETIDANIRLLQRFGREILIDWNLDDADGNALPASSEGMMAIPLDLASTILSRWNLALAGVAAPLEEPSTDGVAASIPMVPL